MSGDNLRECPFCGKEVKLDETVYYINSHGEPGVWCWNCGAKGPNDVSYERADEMWNLRRPEADLRARIAELEAQTRWIPVEERLPEDDQTFRYLALCNHWHYTYDVVYYDYEKKFFYCAGSMVEVTHWMPLPPPPESK